MACPSQTYAGLESARSLLGWSGGFSDTANNYFEPDSLADLVNLLQRATSQGHVIHVVGSGWAFENIAWSPDWMVSLAQLNHRLTNVTDSALNPQWLSSQVAGTDRLFHIEAGATIADLNDALAAAGLAMPTLGGNVGQAVAGALSTSTHGGDPTQPPLADAVMAMHLVTVEAASFGSSGRLSRLRTMSRWPWRCPAPTRRSCGTTSSSTRCWLGSDASA